MSSLHFLFDVTSVSLRFCCALTSKSLRDRIVVNLVSRRRHFEFASSSCQFNFNFTSDSHGLHLDFTSVHFVHTQEKMGGAKGKSERAPHLDLRSKSTWPPYHAHPRMKRNDFPSGLSPKLRLGVPLPLEGAQGPPTWYPRAQTDKHGKAVPKSSS